MKHFASLLLCLFSTAAISAQASVRLGNEVLAQQDFKPLVGKRIGLISNPSGVNSKLEAVVDSFRNASGVKLVALFAPEHGIYGDIDRKSVV